MLQIPNRIGRMLILTLLAALFTACGGAAPAAQPSTAPAAATTAPAAEATKAPEATTAPAAERCV